MNNVKIYSIKSGAAASNAEKLFSDGSEFFLWNNRRFKKNSVGDKIFFVNKTGSWALYTVLVDKGIETDIDEERETTTFTYEGEEYLVEDKFTAFCRFDIKKKVPIPDNWNWTKNIGQSEIYHLLKKNITNISDRIQKLEDLKKLFGDGEAHDVLTETQDKLRDMKKGETAEDGNKDDLGNELSNFTDEYHDILLTIKTKPFIILAGLSGTGKSRMVRTMAYKTCPKELQGSTPGNFKLIKVRPNWHDSSEVVGYVSRLNGETYVVTPFIQFLVKAWKYSQTPFFLCLDEMNLAPVEQYFAEYLSVFETRRIESEQLKTDDIIPPQIFQQYEEELLQKLQLENPSHKYLIKQFKEEGLTLPPNLVVMGTVNMDETTHSFSHKVLDRAMTIEKNHIDLEAGLEEANEDWSYKDSPLEYNQVMGDKIFGGAVYNDFSASEKVIEFLKEVNKKLKGTPFLAAYRVRDEFLIYCYHFSQLNDKPEDWLYQALDNMTHMKLLPKIEGEADQTVPALDGLEEVAEEYSLDRSIEKINQMKKKAERLRYTSYWY